VRDRIEGLDAGEAHGLLLVLLLLVRRVRSRKRHGIRRVLGRRDDLAQSARTAELPAVRMPCSSAPGLISCRNGLPSR